MDLLKFSTGNAKLNHRLIFSLPAGYSCPSAGVCKTFADRITGKINDDLATLIDGVPSYRCFAAMAETRPNVRNLRWYNWDLLKRALYTPEFSKEVGIQGMQNLLCWSIQQHDEDLIRVHESGEFWTEQYMKAWLLTARLFPNRTFYAFTKSLNMWLNLADIIPSNFYLTASVGGLLDQLIPGREHIFTRRAYVVYTEEEAAALGLEIDHDDSHCLGDKPFALLVHGSQRAGSDAMKAITRRKREGKFVGYHKERTLLAA